MAKRFCFSCQDPVEEFVMDIPTGVKTIDPTPYCKDCWLEKNATQLPKVTDSNLAPPGTGTVPRQQHGRKITGG